MRINGIDSRESIRVHIMDIVERLLLSSRRSVKAIEMPDNDMHALLPH